LVFSLNVHILQVQFSTFVQGRKEIFKDKGIVAVRNLKEGSHGCKKEQETLRGS